MRGKGGRALNNSQANRPANRRRRAAMDPGSAPASTRRGRQPARTKKPSVVAPLDDIGLAKQTNSPKRNPVRRPASTSNAKQRAKKPAATIAPIKPGAKKSGGLSDLLSPKNLTESLKTVNGLRGTVKNWLRYLQQADQMLETFYVTSTSLRETGVLEKLIKNKGKNLTTEDLTGILAALMSSPIGGQLFKSSGDGDDKGITASNADTQPGANSSPPTPPGQ